MVHSKQIFWILILCFGVFYGCHETEIDHTKMVVEGWIGAGDHPVVMLHTSYSLSTNDTTNSTFVDVLMHHMVLFSRIVIFDGEDSVILTGRVDSSYLPPYIYTTTKLKGEVGKTYHLKATYKNFSVSSQTTIPDRVYLDSIRVDIQNENALVNGYANNLTIGNTYVIHARRGLSGQYLLCPLGVFRANSQQMVLQIRNPINWSDLGSLLNFNFPHLEENVSIRIAQIGEEEYQILNGVASQTITQGLLFMETYSNIPTNIIGGNGYWCGLGASEYIISLSKSRTYRYDR